MLALLEAHPNIDVMVFYVVASAILAATLYYLHQAGSPSQLVGRISAA